MYTWGYGPYDNEYALNMIGGYTTADAKYTQLSRAIEGDCSKGPYGAVAALCDSFGVTDYCGMSGIDWVKEVRSRATPRLMAEIHWAILSIATIEKQKRLELLYKGLVGIKHALEIGDVDSREELDILQEVYVTGGTLYRKAKKADVKAIELKEYDLKQYHRVTTAQVKETGVTSHGLLLQVVSVYKNSQGRVMELHVKEYGGQVRAVSPTELKAKMKAGLVTLVNYKLTKDNKLIPSGHTSPAPAPAR